MFQFVKRMKIDEERAYVLTKYATEKGKKDKKESDHNPLIVDFEILMPSFKSNNTREEIFDLRNEEGQKVFKELSNNSSKLTNCFKDASENVNNQMGKWKKNLEAMLHKSFKKIRLTRKKKKETEVDKLLNDKIKLRKILEKEKKESVKNKIMNKIDKLENKISKSIAEKNVEKVKDHFKALSTFEGTYSNLKMRKLKKKIMPRSYDPPMTKRDKDGNLATSSTTAE